MLAAGAAEFPASSASMKMGESHHFIRENADLFRQEAWKWAFFSKKYVFFTVSRLRSENALLGAFTEYMIRDLKKRHHC